MVYQVSLQYQMKTIIVTLLFISASVQAFSQQSINFGIIYGQRLNYRESVFKRVVGTSIEYTVPLVKKVDIRLSAGIEGTSLLLHDSGRRRDNYVAIPFRLGIQPYIYEDKAFLFAESGLTIKTFNFVNPTEIDRRVGLSYALGAGSRLLINERKYLQASLSFNYHPFNSLYKFSWINLRLAYGLKWGGNQE